MALSAKKAAQKNKNKKKEPGQIIFIWRKGRNEKSHLADEEGIDQLHGYGHCRYHRRNGNHWHS